MAEFDDYDNLSVIVYQDPRITADSFWSDESSYTQGGPQPGVPVPLTDTDLVLVASGDQSAAKDLRTTIIRPGNPGVAGFGWRNAGEDLWRGCNVPNVITGWRSVVVTIGASDPYAIDEMHALAHSSGKVMCAYRRKTSSGPDAYAVYVSIRTTAGVWSAVEVTTTDADSSFWPCLLELPSGKVLLFRWIKSSGMWNVRTHISTDEGATWAVASRYALRTEVSAAAGATGFAAKRLRAAYLPDTGQILLMAGVQSNDGAVTGRDTYVQYASDDLGGTFTQVEAWGTGTIYGGFHDLIVKGGRVYMLHLSYTGGNRAPAMKVVSNAYESLKSATQTYIDTMTDGYFVQSGSANEITDGDLAACLAEDGSFLVFGRLINTGSGYLNYGAVLRSTDDGETWDPMGRDATVSNAGLWWRPTVSTHSHPTRLTACEAHGRVYLFHGFDSSGSAEDYSLCVAALGGYSTVTMPSHQNTLVQEEQVSWTGNWLPFSLPSDEAWAASGAGTATLSDCQLKIETAAAAKSYSLTPAGTAAEGVIARFQAKMETGGSTAFNTCAFQVLLDDGVNQWEVSIRLTTTGFAVYDEAGAASLATPLVDMTGWVHILVAMDDGTVSVWYAEGALEAGEYVEVLSAEALGSIASTAAANRIRWGNVASGTVTSYWREVHYVSDEWTGNHLAGGQSNPDGLMWRTLTSSPQWVDDGVRLAAVDGPAFKDDKHQVATRYEYPIENILPSVAPSPRRGWRSVSTTQQDIALRLHSLSDDSHMINDVIGVVLKGCNFMQATLRGHNGTAWADLATISMRDGLSALPFVRDGNTITVDTATAKTAGRYIRFGELVGCTVDLGSSVYRKVSWNSEGWWTNATMKRPTLVLEDVVGGDPTSGNCSIWSRDCAFLIHNVAAKYKGFMLRILATPAPPDGYFEIGSLMIGPAVVFGWRTSWGKSQEVESNVELTTADDGTRQSRKRGPARRRMEFAWTDGVDVSEVERKTDDYLLGTSTANALPIASRADVPYLLEGFFATLSGSHTPVCFVPRLPCGTPDTSTQVLPSQWLYGRMVDTSLRLEEVLGEEQASQVWRVGTVTIDEEV